MDFKTAVEHIFKFEGGYSEDSMDAGGETNYGISKRAWPSLDIKNLTKTKAELIYQTYYWDACGCEHLPDRLRFMVFDCAVNQGVMFASRTLQKCVGVKVDGIIGRVTIDAVKREANVGEILFQYYLMRLERYQNTTGFDYFGNGWLARLKKAAELCGVKQAS